jgi:hypothetical protein
MAPNAIACKVVTDRSPNPINQRTTQRFDFGQRMAHTRLLCDVNSSSAATFLVAIMLRCRTIGTCKSRRWLRQRRLYALLPAGMSHRD